MLMRAYVYACAWKCVRAFVCVWKLTGLIDPNDPGECVCVFVWGHDAWLKRRCVWGHVTEDMCRGSSA